MVLGSEATDPEVRIRTTNDRQRLPDWLRARLYLGARRVGRLRREIGAQGGLPTLPAVEIFPEVWRVAGDLLFGQVGVVARGSELHLGVLLPAPSVVQSDDELLRSILLVQLWASISWMVRAATYDRAVHTPTSIVDPTSWFGPDDAARLRSWKHPKIVGMQILADLVAKSVRTVAPPPDEEGNTFHIPDWVLARVKPLVERPRTAVGGRL